MTCEGCKGFFRRSIKSQCKFSCPFSGSCSINRYSRRHCPYCRLQKCRYVGMLQECIMTEQQKEERKAKSVEKQRRDWLLQKEDPPNQIQQSFIKLLQDAYHKVYSPAATSLDLILTVRDNPSKAGDGPMSQKDMIEYLAQITTNRVKRVIDFVKEIPQFLNLDKEDQVELLKSCCLEILILRGTLFYDTGSKSISIGSSFCLEEEDMKKVMALQNLTSPFFKFVAKMKELEIDLTELLLLISITLFSSDRPGVLDKSCIEEHQIKFASVLRSYVCSKEDVAWKMRLRYAHMLTVLVDLRSVSIEHSKCLAHLKEYKLTPLLTEIYYNL